MFAPKNTAVDLLNYLCEHKSTKKAKQPDHLKNFLVFCAKNLAEYKQATSTGQNYDWRIKEAILFAVGSLIEEIQPYKQLRQLVEPMLIEHVLPALQNQQPFLRIRALWLYAKFASDMKFNNDDHLTKVVEFTYICLVQDPALPVRL